MFYLNREFKIVEISREDIIHEFSETTTSPRGVMPKYFYEDGAIWNWGYGGSNLTKYRDCGEEEAKAILYSFAVDDAAEFHNVYFYKTLDELETYIKILIEDEEDEDIKVLLKNSLREWRSNQK